MKDRIKIYLKERKTFFFFWKNGQILRYTDILLKLMQNIF